MAALTLDAVAPDDDIALREWFGLLAAAREHDVPGDPPPCWVGHRSRLTATRAATDSSAWLARDGAEVLGCAELSLPTLDNLDNAGADIVVAPRRRRHGVGAALLAHLADAARAAGRVRLVLESQEPLDAPGPGALFLAAAGAHKALADQRRRLTLPPPDEAALDAMAAAAHTAATDYDLVGWTGPTPPEWLDDVARLIGRMSTDAPLGDLHLAPQHFDAQRIRARDIGHVTRGLTCSVTAARGPDGRLGAYTVIFRATSHRWYANQGDTIVAPEHRGHRLGTLVKLANLARVRAEQPALRVVDTYNADSNPWMVSINETMGFRPLDRYGQWELDL